MFTQVSGHLTLIGSVRFHQGPVAKLYRVSGFTKSSETFPGRSGLCALASVRPWRQSRSRGGGRGLLEAGGSGTEDELDDEGAAGSISCTPHGAPCRKGFASCVLQMRKRKHRLSYTRGSRGHRQGHKRSPCTTPMLRKAGATELGTDPQRRAGRAPRGSGSVWDRPSLEGGLPPPPTPLWLLPPLFSEAAERERCWAPGPAGLFGISQDF